MRPVVRYEILLHPDCVDRPKPVPNAWLCHGYDSEGQQLCLDAGNTPEQALSKAKAYLPQTK